MNKRILSLVLALVMVLGTFAVVSAEEAKVENMTQANKIQWLVDNKIVTGNKIGKDGEATELDLDGNLTREQATKLLVYVIGQEDFADTLKGSLKLFKDVELGRWSNGYINVAATYKTHAKGEPVVKGYPDGTFGPDRNVTYAELATMLVRIMKGDVLEKEDIKFAGANWATQYMRWAAELGILDGVKVVDSNAPASRRDAFEMIFNAKYRFGTDNDVKFGDQMGIVSKLAAGKVEINQDPKMTYNITYNTNFTNGTDILSLSQNAVRPGSLVRLITDKDNNVLYMIELGNPRVGAIDENKNDRWATVARNTVSAMKKGDKYVIDNFGTAKFDGRNKINFYNENETTKAVVDILGSTKVFVADVNNNFLKEVKSVADAMNYFGYNGKYWENEKIDNVYAGYDITKWGNEARVIVFNTTHKSNTDGQLLRVVTPGTNSKHNVELENTKGERISANAGNWYPLNYFPGNERFDYMDVVEFNTVKGTNNLYTRQEVVIDYSKDNVYGVDSIDYKDRTVTLVDENNRKETFILAPGFDEFLEGQLGSMNVQIALGNPKNDMRVINVISNVNLAKRGRLNATPEGPRVIENALVINKGGNYVDVKYVINAYGDTTIERFEVSEGVTLEKGKSYDLTLSKNEVGYQYATIVKAERTDAQIDLDNEPIAKKKIEAFKFNKDEKYSDEFKRLEKHLEVEGFEEVTVKAVDSKFDATKKVADGDNLDILVEGKKDGRTIKLEVRYEALAFHNYI